MDWWSSTVTSRNFSFKRFGYAPGDVMVELDRFRVTGQMVDSVRTDDDADDAARLELRKIARVPGRFRNAGTIAKHGGQSDEYGR